MCKNEIVLWGQDGVEIAFEKVFSIEIEGENYIMLSKVEDKEDCYDGEIVVFKLVDGDHGELLVHLKEEECLALIEKCKFLIDRFVNNFSV